MFDFIKNLLFGNQKREAEANRLTHIQQQAKEITLRANEEALRIKQEAQKTLTEALEVEKSLSKKEEQIAVKEQGFTQEKQQIEREKQSLNDARRDIDEKRDAVLQKLEKIAQMTKDQARTLLLQGWEEKLKADIAKRIKQADEEVRQTADEKAKQILVDAMRYGATDYVAEYTLSVVHLPSDDYKGRIIGKEGRNIRAFEIATGVDVDLEEEGVMKLSSFDSVRREIARVALERLIKDGRIQPLRIEEIVAKTREEIEKVIFKAGEELAHKVGIFNLPPEITQLLGKFKYRYSYGQNMIIHTLEETRIGVALAHELKADVNVVKLGCLLHDIGKVIDVKEGSHIDLGVELAKNIVSLKKWLTVLPPTMKMSPLLQLRQLLYILQTPYQADDPGPGMKILKNI